MEHVLTLATVDALCILCPVVAAAVDGWRWRSWWVAGTAALAAAGALFAHVFTP